MDSQLIIVLAVLGLAIAYLGRRYWRSFKSGQCNCDQDCKPGKCCCHGGNICQPSGQTHFQGHDQKQGA